MKSIQSSFNYLESLILLFSVQFWYFKVNLQTGKFNHHFSFLNLVNIPLIQAHVRRIYADHLLGCCVLPTLFILLRACSLLGSAGRFGNSLGW